MTYENGVGVALLLWFFNAIMIVVNVNSQMNRNLKKVGQRLSWLSLTVKLLDRDDLSRPWWKSLLKYLLIVGLNLVFTLASWLYVAGVAVMYVYGKSKDAGAPEAIRAYRWKLKNVEMSFDDMAREIMKLSDKPPEEFEQFREDLRATINAQME